MPASTVGSQQAGGQWRSPRLFAERVAKSPTLMQQAGIADRRPDFCHSLAYPSRVSSGLTGVRSVGENGISSAAAMMTPVQRAWHGIGGSPSSVESDHMPVAPSQQSPAHGAPRTGGSSSSAESDHMPVAHMSPRQPVPQPPGCAGTTEHSVGEGAHMLIPLLYMAVAEQQAGHQHSAARTPSGLSKPCQSGRRGRRRGSFSSRRRVVCDGSSSRG